MRSNKAAALSLSEPGFAGFEDARILFAELWLILSSFNLKILVQTVCLVLLPAKWIGEVVGDRFVECCILLKP